MTEAETPEEKGPRSVYITEGGTNLARNITQRLVAAGHSVTAWVSSAQDANIIRREGALPVHGDNTRPAIVADNLSLSEADTVIHLSPMAYNLPPYARPDLDAAADPLQAEATTLAKVVSESEAIGTLIATSYTFLYADTDTPATEDAPLREGDTPFATAALAAEEALQAAGAALLRAGYLFSGDAGDPIHQLEQLLKRGFMPTYLGKASATANWLHVDDLAAAIMTALEAEAAGVYNITADTPLSVRDFVALFGEKIGLELPPQMPAPVARGLYGKSYVQQLTTSTPADNTKAKTELGWEPHFADIDRALEDVLLAWRAQQA